MLIMPHFEMLCWSCPTLTCIVKSWSSPTLGSPAWIATCIGYAYAIPAVNGLFNADTIYADTLSMDLFGDQTMRLI